MQCISANDLKCSIVICALYLSRNMLGDDVPVLQLLKHLRANGWQPLPEPERHDGSSTKHFGSDNYVSKRHYLQCLVNLGTLLASGLESLPSKRPANYYQKLLLAEDPRQMSISLECQQKQIIDAAAGNASDDEIMESRPVGRVAKRRRLPAVTVPAVSAAPPNPTTDRLMDLLDQTEDTSRKPPDPPASGTGSHASSNHNSSDSSSSDNASSSSSDSSSSVTVARATGKREVYDGLSSQHRIAIDERGVIGQPGYYRRLCIRCPLAGGSHFHQGKDCQKYRNIGAAQCQSLGPREPELYLLAWADAAATYCSRALHMQFKPTVTDMRRALQKYGPSQAIPQ